MNTELEQARTTATRLGTLERDYYLAMLTELFGFKTLEWDFHRVLRLIDEHLYKVYPLLLKMYKQADERFANEVTTVSATFYRQYAALVVQSEDYAKDTHLAERISKAAAYFLKVLEELLQPLMEYARLESDNKEVMERITEAVYAFTQSYKQKMYLLKRVVEHGFNVSTYLKDKAIGMLRAEQPAKASSKKSKAQEKLEVDRNADIQHPILFRRLRAWRNERADELGRPAYSVLPQKALIGIVNELPISGKELLRMPGIGKKSLAMFGKEILAIVQEYIDESRV